MSIIDLFKGSFFTDALTFKRPILSIVALICLVGCGFLQWKLCNTPKEGKLRQYYLAIAFIAVVVIVDFLQLFFKGTDPVIIRDIFGCAVFGLIGLAISAGVWYFGGKRGSKGSE